MAYGIPFASEDGARQVIMRGISYLRTLRHAYERACGSLFRHLKSFQATKQIPWAKPALGMTSWRIGLGGLGTWKVRTSNVGMRSSCAHIHLAAMIMTVLLILVVSVLPAASLQTTPPVRSAKLTRSTKLTRSAKLLRSTNPKMAEAFAKYVRETDERNNSELRRAANLLWVDELSDPARQKAYADLRNGAVQLQQQKAPGSGGENSCPDCMIHHWEGVVFIPGARLDDVLRVLQDYNRHAEYYAPDVAASRIDARDDDHFRVFLRFRRQKVITVVLNTEHEITYVRDSASQAHSRSSATHIAEVENPGKANEREKSREDDNGFLWGMETWWRILEKDNGVYVQSEIVSLTRDIPTGLGWMIGRFVTAVPKESLTFTLEATRKAVLSHLRAKKPN